MKKMSVSVSEIVNKENGRRELKLPICVIKIECPCFEVLCDSKSCNSDVVDH